MTGTPIEMGVVLMDDTFPPTSPPIVDGGTKVYTGTVLVSRSIPGTI